MADATNLPDHVLKASGMSNFEDVAAFIKQFGLPTNTRPGFVSPDFMNFRLKHLHEELREIEEGWEEKNLEKVADGLVDLAYVLLGTAVVMGLPWQRLWNEVHYANMMKRRAEHHADTKRQGWEFDVVKPEGWKPPNIAGVIENHSS